MLHQAIPKGPTPMPEPLIISTLQGNSKLFGWLLAVEVETRITRQEKPFLYLKLRDQKGNEIIARHFDPPRVATLTPQQGKVALLEGVVEEFQSKLNIKLSRAELDAAVSPDLFTVGTRRPIRELEANFEQLMSKVNDPHIYELLQRCFTHDTLARFRRWPAAVHHHGAVVGGLLEHTVNVTTIASQLAQLYPCNQDKVLAGALLHDIGKLEEIEEQPGVGFTPQGRMIGHIILGMQYVQKIVEQIVGFDANICNDLLHIILAHHGTKEFGSPICPATIEALIVHQADMAEAKLTGFLENCDRTAGPDGWTPYNAAYGGALRMP